MRICYSAGVYILGECSRPFASVSRMIEYFSQTSVPIRGAAPIKLGTPVFRCDVTLSSSSPNAHHHGNDGNEELLWTNSTFSTRSCSCSLVFFLFVCLFPHQRCKLTSPNPTLLCHSRRYQLIHLFLLLLLQLSVIQHSCWYLWWFSSSFFSSLTCVH